MNDNIHTFCPRELDNNVIRYRAAPQASSPYLNREPRDASDFVAKYLDLAAQERKAIETLEAELAQRKIAERSYLARAAILTGGDGGPDAA